MFTYSHMLTILNYSATNEAGRQEMQDTLYNIQQSATVNKLKLNANKTFHVIYHKQRTSIYNTIFFMERATIERVHEIRDLGGLYDEHLTFKPHINDILRGTTAIGGALFRFLNEIHMPELAQKMVVTMVRPINEYGFLVWGGRNVPQEKQLDKILHRSTRATLRLPYFHLANRYLPFSERLNNIIIIILFIRVHNRFVVYIAYSYCVRNGP